HVRPAAEDAVKNQVSPRCADVANRPPFFELVADLPAAPASIARRSTQADLSRKHRHPASCGLGGIAEGHRRGEIEYSFRELLSHLAKHKAAVHFAIEREAQIADFACQCNRCMRASAYKIVRRLQI